MSDLIRVLHFADIHIGVENHGRHDAETGLSTRVRDFLRRMDEMIAYAKEHEVDLIIFAGDAFKNRAPTPTLLREFAYRVREMAALAPVVLLVGNHDLPQTALKASSVEVFETLDVHNVWVAHQFEGRVIETRRGPVYVGAAPFPMRAHVLSDEENAQATSIAEASKLLNDRVAENLAVLAGDADQQNMPRLLTGHFTVSGAMVQRGSERAIMLGTDVEVMISALAPPGVWDYIAMGHVHKHQNVTNAREGMPPVVYSGSMERIDFGEEHDQKGFVWLELARGAAAWEFVPVAARPFVTLRGDLRASEDPTEDAVALTHTRLLDEAVVRMILDLTPETANRLNEKTVREAIYEAGAHLVAGIQKVIDEPARTRLGDTPEGLTDLELLDRYLITKEVRPERREGLLEAAVPLIDAASQDAPVAS
ncbi:MAG TPA: exonuclease SbcCD subunit D [Candidatus Limnocylindrales bacterium]|nr:exonuclease SbcCD subunit D [Candidatus Limnocylindrales bacterium]